MGACHGALDVCDGDADEDDLLRLAGLEDLLSGASPAEVAEALDHPDAVGFLTSLAPAAMSLASPLLKKILPGGGGGGGAPAAPGGGGGGGYPSGATMAFPGGPIFVRF
jgi:hypothetical protein